MALVANARMYAVAPPVREAWQSLFDWLADAADTPLSYIDHPAPALLEALWARDDLGAAFMCGFPFASATMKPWLLAAPVPSPPRYGGKPCYCTDFVVRADGPFERLSDTFGGRIGWTVEHSQSGYNAVRRHLLRYPRQRLFAQWVGPLVTPRRVVEAVLAGAIDVGPLDSYLHDLLKCHQGETAAKLRTVESTPMTPIPPLIASPAIPSGVVERLRSALTSCAREPKVAPFLETLLIERFAPARSDDYAMLLAHARDADEGGIPRPARQ